MPGLTLVFFEKYTTLAGNNIAYYSDAFDVSAYKTVVLEVLARSILAAATPAGSAQMEESSDLITWSNLGSAITLNAGTTPDGQSYDGPARYIRLKITLTGTDPVIGTVWAKAVARDC